MPKYERVKKPRTVIGKNTGTQVHDDQRKRIDADTLKKDLDDMLDEIDEVLEENAEQFVRSYVQKGGE